MPDNPIRLNRTTLFTSLLLVCCMSGVYGQEASDQSEEDLYLLDLGIIIESRGGDTTYADEALPAADDPDLIIGKAPPGAEFIASTRELRELLNDLSLRINDLEQSLDQDVEAVRLENDRLRSLIRKIQHERSQWETEGIPEIAPAGEPADQDVLMGAASVQPTYRDIMSAYQLGRYEDVLLMRGYLDEGLLTAQQQIQVAYWCGDAYFRLGQLEEATQLLLPLEGVSHELQDDTLILLGLISLRQGDRGAARGRFQTILDDHPGSDYYRLAELTIKELANL